MTRAGDDVPAVRREDARVDVLVERLRDKRSKKVVFLSHCLLNENTRYLGGACRQCCVREVVEQCMDRGIGMVQMPCPEQEVWGGVLKRRMLRLYGTNRFARRAVSTLLPSAMVYVRLAYRRLARSVAARIDDYSRSGFTVVGIVGIDGSPTCGVRTTVDVGTFASEMSRVDPSTFSVDEQNAMVRRHATSGRGIFIEELERALDARGLRVPMLAHDLFAELDGCSSTVEIGAVRIEGRRGDHASSSSRPRPCGEKAT